MLPVSHPLDRQQQTLYNAQIEAFRGTVVDSALSTTECLNFNETIFYKAQLEGYWRERDIPALSIAADLGGYDGLATWYRDSYKGSRIELLPTGKRGWVVAHEAAHIILMAGRPECIAFEIHGKEYATVYIWAMGALFGTNWSNRLKRAFAKANVEFTRKRTDY